MLIKYDTLFKIDISYIAPIIKRGILCKLYKVISINKCCIQLTSNIQLYVKNKIIKVSLGERFSFL